MGERVVATITVYETGDTGVEFLDAVNDASLADILRQTAGKIESGAHRETRPAGE